MVRPESIILGTDAEVLTDIFNFYAPQAKVIVDTTANSRKMWRGTTLKDKVFFLDIDKEMKPNVVADFFAMPLKDNSVDVLVWDPPHLPSAAGTEKSLKPFVKNYGLSKTVGGDNVSCMHQPFLVEAARVLKPKGLLFVKIKDFVHNHRYQWSLVDFVQSVRSLSELTACDLRIKRDPCAGNLKSSKWKKTHHARNVHTWWVIVRKGKCEA